jgi:hypothetical protein
MGERTRFVVQSYITLELDGEFTGLFVDIARPTIGEHAQWRRIIYADVSTLDESEEQAREIVLWLGERLVAWNLANADGDVPASTYDLERQEPAMITAIAAAYTRVVGRVRAPLASPSTGGSRSVEAQIPMETP